MLLALQHCKEFCEKYYFSQDFFFLIWLIIIIVVIFVIIIIYILFYFYKIIRSKGCYNATRRFIIDCRATVIRCRIDAVGAIDYLSTSAVAIVT